MAGNESSLRPGARVVLKQSIERTILDDGKPTVLAFSGSTVEVMEQLACGWTVRTLGPEGIEFMATTSELS